MSERKHSLFSPSRLAMLHKCPSWLGKVKISTDAQRGIDLHDIIISLFLQGINQHDETMVDFALRELQNIKQKYPHTAWQSEVYLETSIPHVSGYADIVGLDTFEDVGIIIELKSGFTERPDARDNIQLKAYSLGLLRQVETVHGYMIEIDQRKTSHDTFTRADIPLIEGEILEIIRKSLQGGQYNTGGHCDYCAKSLICPAIEKAVMTVQQLQTLKDEPKSLLPAEVSQRLSKYWDAMTLIEKYWDNLKARAISIIEAGGDVEGFMVKTSSGARRWTDEEKAIKSLQATGIDVSKVMTLQSPTNVEKNLKASGMKLADIKSLLSGLTSASERRQLIKKEVA